MTLHNLLLYLRRRVRGRRRERNGEKEKEKEYTARHIEVDNNPVCSLQNVYNSQGWDGAKAKNTNVNVRNLYLSHHHCPQGSLLARTQRMQPEPHLQLMHSSQSHDHLHGLANAHPHISVRKEVIALGKTAVAILYTFQFP